jgi:hypothetical protein
MPVSVPNPQLPAAAEGESGPGTWPRCSELPSDVMWIHPIRTVGGLKLGRLRDGMKTPCPHAAGLEGSQPPSRISRRFKSE